jgi:deoxyribonuclease V
MFIKSHHSWELNFSQAIELQKELSKKVVLKDKLKNVRKIAGVDVKFIKELNKLICAVLIFTYPSLEIIEEKYWEAEPHFPYIPGLLSFREGPVVEKCFEKIENIPDLVFFDGHGYSHPRRAGLASHMGIILDLPSVGCAKKKLCGNYNESSLQKEKGNFCHITDNNEVIGAAVRTKHGIKPIFISVGNEISLESAIKYTLSVSRFKVPEPTRLAHNHLNTFAIQLF